MPKINILDKSIFNRIAAGEVVEKPASVVKEMVENSIDAGATSITIDILGGGIDRIRVSDNGCGIDIEDMPKAFMPHATSKISTIDDLDKICTLGFRGEALCSIASVAKVTLISKTSDGEGYKYAVQGGEVTCSEPFGCADGTTIIMEDLFYNVPARAKFLRKPKQEETEITNYVSRLIMANPSIVIKYVCDNKTIFKSSGTGLFDAIYAIYGKQIVDNLIDFDTNIGDYHIHGYIGKPTFTKANRTYQTLIINGRYVINQTISTAVYKAYENYLMKGNFPFFVINFDVPYDKVDVNVHPNKLDVKFEDNNKVFGAVYNCISDILFKTFSVKEIVEDLPTMQSIISDLDKAQSVTKINPNEGKSYVPNSDGDAQAKEVNLSTSESKFNDNLINVSKLIGGANTGTLKSDGYAYNLASLMSKIETADKPQESISQAKQEQTNLNLKVDNYKIIGVAFNTYIIVQQNDYLLFIDQHAAHERLLYDKFKSEYMAKNTSVQPLIVPYILNVNYEESNFISNNISVLADMGFELDEFGDNCYKVNAVPLTLKNIDLKQFFNDVLSNITNKLVLSKADAIEDYLARSACRSAVKANDILSNNEISTLLAMLSKDNQVLQCPHGRPVVIKITDKEIEKWFKRIV